MPYDYAKLFSAIVQNTILFCLLMYVKKFIFLPHSVAQYLYVIPFLRLFLSSFEFFNSITAKKNKIFFSSYYTVLCSISALMLSPFLHWWLLYPDIPHFYFATLAFIFSLALLFFNYAWILKSFVESFMQGTKFLTVAKFARLFILFGLIAPLLALIIASIYGQNNGYDVYLLLINLSSWRKIVLCMPIFIFVVLADFTKIIIEKKVS